MKKLDFARIGREAREGECGVFTQRGYVIQTEDLEQVYGTLNMKLKKPNYVCRLVLTSEETGQCVTLDLPATQKQIDLTLMEIDLDSYEGAELVDYDGPIWDLNIDLYEMGGLEPLNDLAKAVGAMDHAQLVKFKAVLSATECADVREALQFADRLDEFVYSDHILSPEDLARDELSFSLSDRQRQILERHVNLYAYGQDIMKDQNAVLTPYGLLQREDGTPVLGVQEEQSQGGMEMA